MINVEVCINSTTLGEVTRAVSTARASGVARIELCSHMDQDGLTPPAAHIRAARKAFGTRKGLMVMVRPRAGDFCYSSEEIDLIKQQIRMAAADGANGVVTGMLQKGNGQVDRPTFERLVDISHSLNLQVTFHRAFDAVPDPFEALKTLIDCGADRVLTSGTPWGSGKGAAGGVKRLAQFIEQANGQIEIVIGGGINPRTAQEVLRELPLQKGPVSVHAFSGVQHDGVTTREAVQKLIHAVNATR